MKAMFLCLLLALSAAVSAMAQESTLPPGFDAQRHMLVSEVKPGMKGYGLSVFSGTKIERFEAEVISVLHNFNPKQDVVLIRVSGCNLEHTGAIAGMSGSPVFLQDETGKYRMIGAFAYGWPMMKDPVAGVQPIQYMLSIPLSRKAATERATTQPTASLSPAATTGQWSALTAMVQAKSQLRRQLAAPPATAGLSTSMRPLMMPLSVSGLSAGQLQQLAPVFSPSGLMPLQAGSSSALPAASVPAKLEPGSVMAVPLLAGDIDMTAVGTCTEIIGDKAYGFGHPFTSEGPVLMPMCSGYINGIIANLITSFKLGSAAGQTGTLLADQSAGVAGMIGAPAPTAPITLHVKYADKSVDQVFHFQSIIHPHFTPMIASAAMFGALSASRDLPQHNTVSYRITAHFADGHQIQISDTLTHVNPATLFTELGVPLSMAADNPFSRVLLKSLEGDVQVWDTAREAQILSAGVLRQLYRPGETVRFFVSLRPFRSVDIVEPIDFRLPDDLADGSYTITISDLNRHINDEHANAPFRFTASNINDVFDAINEVGKMQSDAFYLRLVRQQDQAVAIGRTSLAQIPATHRQLLLGTNRADVMAFTPSVTHTVPSRWVITGSADLTVQVTREPHQIPLSSVGSSGDGAATPSPSVKVPTTKP